MYEVCYNTPAGYMAQTQFHFATCNTFAEAVKEAEKIKHLNPTIHQVRKPHREEAQ